MNKILEVKNLSFGYGNNLIFDNISFSVARGEFVAIVGGNGAGKTSLMKLIIGQLKASSGTIVFDDRDNIGYVPQLSAAISNNFPITVREILALNLLENKRFSFINRKREADIDSMIKLIGLNGKKNYLYGDLSGGQKQKTMLGKALIANPNLLLLDEPLIGLDEESKKSFLDLLAHQSRVHHITILMITHELDEIRDKVDKILKIGNGSVVEC